MEGPNEPVSNPFLRPSKLFGVVDTSSPQRSLLRPSVLTATAEKLRTDKPSGIDVASNPFASASQRAGSSMGSTGPLASNPFFKVKGKLVEEEEEKESTSRSTLAAAAAANMNEVASLAPTNGSQLPLAPQPAGSGPVGFIFGQNISERVVKETKDEANSEETLPPLPPPQQQQDQEQHPEQLPEPVEPLTSQVVSEPSGGSSVAVEDAVKVDADTTAPSPPPDGGVGGDSCFGAASFGAIAASRSDDEEAAAGTDLEASKRSLTESAQEYQARQARPEFDEVEVLTGEENESNVLHLICRAFIYDRKNNKWTERGRGFMRLNDAVVASEEDGCSRRGNRLRSRLIFRLQGSLKVVLNTPVWSGMLVEQADEKRIRLTAQVPDEGVRILLFQLNSANEAHHLLSALNSRILQLRQTEEQEATVDRSAGQTRKRRFSGASSSDGETMGKERKERKTEDDDDVEEDDEDDDEEDEEKMKRVELPPARSSDSEPAALSSDSP